MSDTLCMQCGLCCDGTFYGSVVVERQEIGRLERIGLRIVDQDGVAAMPQPCVALRGCVCSVYADRPSACAKYECQLLKTVSAGECTARDGLVKVQAVHALLATIRTAFACPPTASIWEAILALEEAQTPEGQADALRKYGPGIDAVTKLIEIVRTEFEPRFAGGAAR